LTDGDGRTPCVTGGTAYLMILKAVEAQPGLVHGRLHDHGAHCAIGSYFDVNRRSTLQYALIDEVAAVNDSVPKYTRAQRKRYVKNWLRWKLGTLGMALPGPRAKR
jgi:hypothetical protein